MRWIGSNPDSGSVLASSFSFLIREIASLFNFPWNSSTWFVNLRPSVPASFCNSLCHRDLSKTLLPLSLYIKKLLGRIEQFRIGFSMNFSELNSVLWFAQPCGFPSGDPEIVLPWIISGLHYVAGELRVLKFLKCV